MQEEEKREERERERCTEAFVLEGCTTLKPLLLKF